MPQTTPPPPLPSPAISRTVEGFDWLTWIPQERATLLFIFQDDQVLLIHKKRGLGQGKVNAPGGRLEYGETYAQAAIRETQEEVCLDVTQVIEAAELSFVFTDGYSLHAYVYFAYHHQGTPTETDEAIPFWCPVDQIPWEKMWDDDIIWLKPVIEQNLYAKGRFIFDGDTMLSHQVTFKPRE